jgi:CxxC-x17-CxxC domain-containing protein
MIIDVTLTCIDCGGVFPFSAADQNYYRAHNYSSPVRCKPCKVKWREKRAATALAESASSNPQPNTTSPPTQQLPVQTVTEPSAPTSVTVSCSDCGKPAEVNFEPKPGWPVYCRACYGARKNSRATG